MVKLFMPQSALKRGQLAFFTDREAWNLFRLAAFAEAIGWTLLISGILIVRYLTPGNNDAVQVAGQLHGTFFIVYFIASLALAASLGWNRRRTVIAAALSVVPYGSLFFEKWEALRRDRQQLRKSRQLEVYAVIELKQRCLAVQLNNSSNWVLPGGEVPEGESSEQTLVNLVWTQLGIKPRLGQLLFIHEHSKKLELYFVITNAKDFATVSTAAVVKRSPTIDELSFINPKAEAYLVPSFLQTALAGNLKAKTQIITS